MQQFSYAQALLILKRPRREASFVDCSVEFTKTSRAVSIVIALSCSVPGANPEAAGDAPKPITVIRCAVNPCRPRRHSRTNLPSWLLCCTPSRCPSSRLALHDATTPHAGGECKCRFTYGAKLLNEHFRLKRLSPLMRRGRSGRLGTGPATGLSRAAKSAECPPRWRPQSWQPMSSSLP